MTAIACKYFIQNETAENDLNGSNLFLLSKKYNPGEKVKFKDVITEFPLNNIEGISYHLRFQTFLPEAPTSPIWVDILNEEASVPLAEPGIVRIKALKLPSGLKQRLKKSNPTAPRDNFTFEAKPAESIPANEPESDGSFDIDINDSTPNKEEQKVTRPRIDSDAIKTTFDIFPDNVGSDSTPILQPTKPSESAPRKTVPQPTIRQPGPDVVIRSQAKVPVSVPKPGPSKVDIVGERVKKAVSCMINVRRIISMRS